MKRKELTECNLSKALKNTHVPLNIQTSNETCEPYDTKNAKQILLANLSANKHIDINVIILPKQNLANCWFNAMFVMFFISDKGRIFFHFFRHLMIEGKQKNGKRISKPLQDIFALFNFAIDASLTGNKIAHHLDTNEIIHKIYRTLHPRRHLTTIQKKEDETSFFHLIRTHIPNRNEPWNPIYYYMAIVHYLGNDSIRMLFVHNFQPPANALWVHQIEKEIQGSILPHMIVVEIFDGMEFTPGFSGQITNRPLEMVIRRTTYRLDSVAMRDVKQQHFAAFLTCEKRQMVFEGFSSRKLIPFEWKTKLNKTEKWKFGDKSFDWSFMHSYQLLMYYRV
jgi:hypothetical protein